MIYLGPSAGREIHWLVVSGTRPSPELQICLSTSACHDLANSTLSRVLFSSVVLPSDTRVVGVSPNIHYCLQHTPTNLFDYKFWILFAYYYPHALSIQLVCVCHPLFTLSKA